MIISTIARQAGRQRLRRGAQHDVSHAHRLRLAVIRGDLSAEAGAAIAEPRRTAKRSLRSSASKKALRRLFLLAFVVFSLVYPYL